MAETKKAAPGEQPEGKNVSSSSSANTIIPQKGITLTEDYINNIPHELKEQHQWVLWRLEERKGKLTKVPYMTSRKLASSTDPNTWTSFDSAVKFYKQASGHFNGIGYVFSSDDPYTGIDLDKCISKGNISDEAKAIIKALNSYTERSQSKTGLHAIIKAVVPGERNRTGNIEMYDNGRFFAITGDHVKGTPNSIEERQQELDALYKRTFEIKPKQSKQTTTDAQSTMTDDDIISAAAGARNGEKFRALFSGDDSDYTSGSEADLALCNLLAFYTKDPEQIDRIVRRSGLYREKWDRDDYSAVTIGKALSDVTEQYAPMRKKNNVIKHPAVADQDLTLPAGKPKFGKTDLGNAQRLVYYFGEDLRYNYLFGTWYIWNGKRWCTDETGEIERRAKKTVLNIYREALEEDDDKRAALMKHGTASESYAKIMSMINAARSEEGIPITPSQLDGDQWKLNCNNGIIDLKTGKLLPHDRNELMTNLVATDYDPDTECPHWMKFLNRIMQDDQGNDRPALVEFLQRAVGYSLTGSIKEQVMFVLYGSGKNGKSTFINVIKDLLGEYARQSSTETFMAKQNSGGIPNDIARLKGARLVSAVESEEGKRLAESLIKQMTGGEPMTARFLHKEFFEFTPTFKIFFVTNHKPQIRNSDLGIWRRIRLIPFTVTITPDEDDKSLPEKLRDEMPGILRWAVEGCLKWQTDGLKAPLEVTNATDEYRNEMDTMSHFVKDYCIIHPLAQVSTKDLYEAYKDWCDEGSERPLTKNKFITKLRERMESGGTPIKELRTNKMRGWTGIGLASDTELPDMSDTGDTQKAIINNNNIPNHLPDNRVTSVTSVTESVAGQQEVATGKDKPKAWEEGEL